MIDYAYRAKTLTHSVNCYPLCVKIINILDDSGTFSVIIIVPNIVWKVSFMFIDTMSISVEPRIIFEFFGLL